MHSDEHDHRLDQLLDNALRQYGAAEPRLGLEGRVLARLRAEQSRPALNWHPRWLLVAVAAVAALAFMVALVSRKRYEPAGLAPIAKARQLPAPSPVKPQQVPGPTASSQRQAKARNPTKPFSLPKRDQFPSPAPLSEQEQMLARYVSQYPREAGATARAQTSLFKREEEERAALTLTN
jgi:hypothetical protein